MNKISKIILSVLGGIDVVVYMFTPILLSVIWVTLSGIESYGSLFFYSLGLLSTIFRAYKIGWMK